MADLEKIVDDLSSLTLLEAAELTKMLEEKWGVSAAAPMAMAAMPGMMMGGAEGAAEEEKSEFDVVLKEIGPKKINVIKEVRALTALGLKEAKEVVDNLGTVMEGVGKEAAEEAKAKLEEAGAVVELK
ncbi:50S ribosomal protein L7/L12 [Candidatus Leptofilum sp.]|uniref:50S ribosomal protein L7/L12 n=1 Tax=Candidatus Leptofilum sp. TaxID=3241576 RepID=UPI003B5A0EB1